MSLIMERWTRKTKTRKGATRRKILKLFPYLQLVGILPPPPTTRRETKGQVKLKGGGDREGKAL